MPLNTNAAFQALPLVEPIAQGRSCAGTSSVAVSQASATTTYTAPAAASCSARRAERRRGSRAARTAASAGQRDERLEQLHVEGDARARRRRPAASASRPVSHARTISSSASTISAIITASIVSLREVITSTGSTASASGRGEPGGRAPHAPDGHEQQRHRGDPGERLGQLQRRRGEAEQLHARDLQPQVDRRLVDRHARRRARTRRRRSCARRAPCCARRRRRTGRARPCRSWISRSAAAASVIAASSAHSTRRTGLLIGGTLVSSPRGERADRQRRSDRGVPWAAGVYGLPRHRQGDLQPRRRAEHRHLPLVRRRRRARRRASTRRRNGSTTSRRPSTSRQSSAEAE